MPTIIRSYESGIAQLFELEADLTSVAETSKGKEALDLAESLTADAVVMGARMPGTSGIEATRHLSNRLPHVRVLVLIAHEDDERAYLCRRQVPVVTFSSPRHP